MKAVSGTYRLHESELKLYRLPLSYAGLFIRQGQKQIQSLFNGLGFKSLAVSGDFERED